MSEPYAIARPDEIYVPWGRPADLGPVPGLHADAMTTARAALGLMVERVTWDAEYSLGMILWEATARLRRLDEKIGNVTLATRWQRKADMLYPRASRIGFREGFDVFANR